MKDAAGVNGEKSPSNPPECIMMIPGRILNFILGIEQKSVGIATDLDGWKFQIEDLLLSEVDTLREVVYTFNHCFRIVQSH
mgnify:CR=1 FL=1